jgi:hypothetical protein
VKVEILNGAGIVPTAWTWARSRAGRHGFDWPAGTWTDGDGLRFRITATAGAPRWRARR